MFAPISHFHPCLIFASKAGSQPLELGPVRGSTLVSSSPIRKYCTRAELTGNGKHPSLLWYNNYCRKKSCITGSRSSVTRLGKMSPFGYFLLRHFKIIYPNLQFRSMICFTYFNIQNLMQLLSTFKLSHYNLATVLARFRNIGRFFSNFWSLCPGGQVLGIRSWKRGRSWNFLTDWPIKAPTFINRWPCPRNTNWGGRLSTVDLINAACFAKR